MKRRLPKLCVFLLLGAIVNIGVAWVCCWSASADVPILGLVEKTLGVPYSQRSRYADAAVCIGDTSTCCCLQLSFGNYSGGWCSVPNLEAHLPDWARAFLDDEAIVSLQREEEGTKAQWFEAGGWPWLSACGSCIVQWQGSWPTRTCVVNGSKSAILIPAQMNRLGTVAGRWNLLPLRPVWPGFALSTFFYTAVLWLLLAAPFALRRHLRVRRNRCPHCAYPVGASDVCTECGKPVK
jgi:hypothetical protein